MTEPVHPDLLIRVQVRASELDLRPGMFDPTLDVRLLREAAAEIEALRGLLGRLEPELAWMAREHPRRPILRWLKTVMRAKARATLNPTEPHD